MRIHLAGENGREARVHRTADFEQMRLHIAGVGPDDDRVLKYLDNQFIEEFWKRYPDESMKVHLADTPPRIA